MIKSWSGLLSLYLYLQDQVLSLSSEALMQPSLGPGRFFCYTDSPAPSVMGRVYELIIAEKTYRIEISGTGSEPPTVCSVYLTGTDFETYTRLEAFEHTSFLKTAAVSIFI